MADSRGRTFDILDKAVAERARVLLSRESLTIQDVQAWQTDYNQLAAYGRGNSDVEYVARQWRDEEPRYANVVAWLMAKVKTPIKYTPRLYNEDLSLSGGACCGCNGTSLTDKGGSNDVVIPPHGFSTFRPTQMPQSVGGAVKNFFGLPDTGHYSAPQIANVPLGNEPISTSNALQYVLFAALAAGIFYAVWKVSKKK